MWIGLPSSPGPDQDETQKSEGSTHHDPARLRVILRSSQMSFVLFVRDGRGDRIQQLSGDPASFGFVNPDQYPSGWITRVCVQREPYARSCR